MSFAAPEGRPGLRRSRRVARTAIVACLATTLAAGLVTACGAGKASDAGASNGEEKGQRRTGSTGSRSAGRAPTATPPTPTPSPTPSPSRSASPKEPARTPWGPTAAELADARAQVRKLGLADEAAQVIVAGYEGTGAPTEYVRDIHVGGLIQMGYNVESAEGSGDVNRALEREQRALGKPWPLWLGVDQEGGSVTRIPAPVTQFPAYLSLGASGRTDLATRAARANGDELRGLGFTAVFAPDADVTAGPSDPTIGSRSAGSDPATVARIVAASLDGYDQAGMIAVPKHFPGHGSVTTDSHLALPVQRASLETLQNKDFRPFERAIDAGAGALMVAHIDLHGVDPGVPSSLSHKVVQGLLRDTLGFQGVVVTDGLDMGAITDEYGSADAGVRALQAGADVLLMPVSASRTRDAIVRAVHDGRLPRARLDQAATRMVALLLHQRASAASIESAHSSADRAAVRPGAGDSDSYAESLAGLTIVSGSCSGRLVGDEIQVVGATSQDRERFGAAARAAGLRVGSSGQVVRLLSTGSSSGSGDVVVSLATPYGLGFSRASKARIALYGRTPEAFRALTDVLLGKARGTGHLPVPVHGVRPAAGCDAR